MQALKGLSDIPEADLVIAAEFVLAAPPSDLAPAPKQRLSSRRRDLLYPPPPSFSLVTTSEWRFLGYLSTP
jgi:hypothetical protein